MAAGNSSFSEFLAQFDPSLLPSGRGSTKSTSSFDPTEITHGTTIVTATYPGGVVMAGDRRATAGNIIAQRDIEKVFAADEHTVVGIAGTAGVALEIVRLFQVELEHYEKMEGASLSLEGKANRLAALLRAQSRDGHAGISSGAVVRWLRFGPRVRADLLYDVTGGRYRSTHFTQSGQAACSRADR
jgi:proteasome beta subunit